MPWITAEDLSAFCIYDFSQGPMADEQKLNGSPSINKEYYYYYYINISESQCVLYFLKNILIVYKPLDLYNF